MIDTAVILAGGVGTRLRPLTEVTPKPLLPVKGKPTIQHIIENLRTHTVKNIILSVGYKAEMIQNYFKNGSHLDVNITYSAETEPLGTGGAIKKAARHLKKPFFLIWGDGLMNLDYTDIARFYSTLPAARVLLMVLTERQDVENFGVVQLQGSQIIKIIEKPKREDAPTNIVDIGAYIIDPSCLTMLPEGKSSIELDCFGKLVPQRKAFAYVYKGAWFPTDTLEKYTLACENFTPENNDIHNRKNMP